MKTPTQIFIISCMAFVAILPLSCGYAIDNGVPYWQRPTTAVFIQSDGDENTTYQRWQSAAPPLPLNPQMGDGPFYGPGVVITNNGNGGLDANTVTMVDGFIHLNNFLDEEPLKWIYIQFTTAAEVPFQDLPGGNLIESAEPPLSFTLLDFDHTNQLVNDNQYYNWELWQLGGGLDEVNPTSESLFAPFLQNAGVDLVIDTRSFNGVVPEPATMAILGSSLALGALAKRRKAKSVS